MREALIVWGGWNGHEPQQGAEIIRDFSMRMVSQFASRGLFAATIDDGVAKTASGETFVFRPARSLTEGKAVTVGIRPEHFQRSGEGSGPTGTISIIEPTGGQTFLTMEVAGKPTVMTVSGDDMVPMGSTLTLFVLPQQVYVFDAETGHRISEN